MHLLISVCKQFHRLVLVALLAEFPEDYCEIIDSLFFYYSVDQHDQINQITLTKYQEHYSYLTCFEVDVTSPVFRRTMRRYSMVEKSENL
jgi:hypothetical protein